MGYSAIQCQSKSRHAGLRANGVLDDDKLNLSVVVIDIKSIYNSTISKHTSEGEAVKKLMIQTGETFTKQMIQMDKCR